MAKVIGRKYPIKKHYKATCEKCGAIIVFDEDEVKDDYQYNEYCSTTGICPLCGDKVSFNKNSARITKSERSKLCGDFCNHYKNGECTYYGTDWRECPLS